MWSQRVRYAVLTIAVLLLCRGTMMIPVFRDHLQDYLRIGDSIFGLLLSIGTGAGLLTVLVGGALVDRWGPRPVLRITLIGVAIAMGVIALSGASWPLLAVALGIFGLSIQPLGVSVNAYLVRLFPANRRRALSLNLAGTSVGELFFPGLAEGLLQLSRLLPAVTFATIFHVPFAIMAVLVLFSSFFYRGSASFAADANGRNRKWQWRDMLLPGPLLAVIALMVMHAVADTTLHLWMPRFLGSEAFDRVVIGPGYVLSGYAISYIVARVGLGLLPEDLGRGALMAAPGVLGGSVLIVGILSRSYSATAGSYVLGAFLWSAEFPAMMSILAHEEPDRFGASLALQQLLTAAGNVLALNGMGYLISQLPEPAMWQAMLVPACVFPCISAGAALWLLRYGSTLRPAGKHSSEETSA